MELALFTTSLPQFSQINIANIEAELDQLIQENLMQIDALLEQTRPFTWDNLMQPLEDGDDRFSKFWSPISHLNSVMNNSINC